jgi:hypothetical protein
MTDRYESPIDRMVREAGERAEFDDLSGAGKPLPGAGQPDDEDWWRGELVRRENLSGAIPPTLDLLRQMDDLPVKTARAHSEHQVRELVALLNERIRMAQRGQLSGPPVTVSTVDAERVVREWCSGATRH